ncbi:hypothetical protein [Methylobacterium oryzisoli]|uniref:hypothetical protein n=1 Tax=Methylobacterium oryzisoli TaxID=3385502 RepID=UPI003892163E
MEAEPVIAPRRVPVAVPPRSLIGLGLLPRLGLALGLALAVWAVVAWAVAA